MIVVNETGAKIMQFFEEFNKYAKDILHITNPFVKFHRSFRENCVTLTDGTVTTINTIDLEKINKKTRAEREEWIRLRDEYVAERILRELGYEVLQTYEDGKYAQDAIPCAGASRQCNMDCKYFGQGECPTLV